MSPSLLNRRQWIAVGGAACLTARCLSTAAQDATGSPQQWWSWRGPQGNNLSAPEVGQISVDPDRYRWRAPIAGRGHSSPVVSDRRVFLTSADKVAGRQFAIGLDRQTGKQLWQTDIHQGGIPAENHSKNTEASSTPAYDGENLFVVFYNDGAIRLTSLTADGDRRWQKVASPYRPQAYKYGYAASPTLYGDLVILAAETDTGSALVAFDRDRGGEVWRTPRPASTTFSSPIVGHVSGRDQLLISGAEMVAAYDPLSGRMLWQTPATTMATCGTMVWNDTHVFASGGYPKSETVCVRADGSGKVEWSSTQKCYEQSMLVVDQHLYAVTDAGVAVCWRCQDGKPMWRERLGGKWSSSPVLVDGQVHVFSESGQGWCFDANPNRFVQRASYRIADEVFATPAVVDDTMYLRVAQRDPRGNRQEQLLALV